MYTIWLFSFTMFTTSSLFSELTPPLSAHYDIWVCFSFVIFHNGKINSNYESFQGAVASYTFCSIISPTYILCAKQFDVEKSIIVSTPTFLIYSIFIHWCDIIVAAYNLNLSRNISALMQAFFSLIFYFESFLLWIQYPPKGFDMRLRINKYCKM